MFIWEEALSPLTLVGFEKSGIAGACSQKAGDIHEREVGSTESQVGVVALDGQIDAQAIDQEGNQDIF